MRRPALTERVAVLSITVGRPGDFPDWHPITPRAGWTPTSALSAARAYADDLADLGDTRRTTSLAYRAILAALPPTQRAEIVERLGGVDRFADLCPSTARTLATAKPPASPVAFMDYFGDIDEFAQ